MTMLRRGETLLGRLGTLRRRLVSGPRVLVLGYHRVADLALDPFELAVSPANFAEHLEVINDFALPVRLRDIGEATSNGTISEGICLTFDDAYADNFHTARPMLEKAGLPATFFATSGQVGSGREFWWDEICRLADEGRGTVDEVISLRDAVVTLPSRDRDLALAQALGWTSERPRAREDYAVMTADELGRLAAHDLFEVGAHTVTHPMLPSLVLREQVAEIGGSKSALEQIVGMPVTSFAYPFGTWSAETASAVEAAGFKRAVTAQAGTVGRKFSPYAIPRLLVKNWDGEELARQLSAWFRHAPLTVE